MGNNLQFWEGFESGAVPELGYLISRELTARLEDGNLYAVQFFERARLEVHGEAVMLGRVGAEVYSRWQAEGRG